jgi:hypothetical protein
VVKLKALVFNEFGGPEVLHISEVAAPVGKTAAVRVSYGANAHRFMESRLSTGKIVLVP